jgi:predicted HicB family RNase H-like nuclease
MKLLLIRIPSELKKALGIIAIKKGVSMTAIVIMLIEKYVGENKELTE